MAPPLRAWMSHALLCHAWHEGQPSEVVMDFVEDSLSLEPPSDIVIMDSLFTIGLMIDIPFYVNDITVRDKIREKDTILEKVFRGLSAIFSSRSIRMPSALRALQLVIRLAGMEVSLASYVLFTTIITSDDLTDQHWEAARLLVCGALRESTLAEVAEVVNMDDPRLSVLSTLGDLKGILRFLDYHLGLQEAGRDHESAIHFAMVAVIIKSGGFQADHLTVDYIEDLIRDSPSFAKGVRSMMHPDLAFRLRMSTVGLIAVTADQRFTSPVPPQEMSEFCERLAVFADESIHGEYLQRCGVVILFEMLRSPEWRGHIVPSPWSMFVYCAQFPGERESFWWCLENAIDLLEFTKGLAGGEELKWWYGTLWFHHEKLDAKVRDEVERIAKDMSTGDGLSDLNLYLSLIKQEVERTQQEVDELPNQNRPARFGMDLRARLAALEGNYNKLARITRGRR